VEQFAVDRQFKATSARRDEREVGDLLLERRQQEARQTDGLGLVASDGAIAQFHVHDAIPVLGDMSWRLQES
jgi:hypothetical protein